VAAYAALRSAALNVFTNAKVITDRIFVEEQLVELEQLLSEAAAATEASYEVVKKKLGS
jgi:formiminotetrahydrofolate cyclodeaminase